MTTDRHLVIAGDGVELLGEARALREDALRRYREVDLLVAALREHIDDLRTERDRLVAENAELRQRLAHAEARAAATWLATRSKGVRPARPQG